MGRLSTLLSPVPTSTTTSGSSPHLLLTGSPTSDVENLQYHHHLPSNRHLQHKTDTKNIVHTKNFDPKNFDGKNFYPKNFEAKNFHSKNFDAKSFDSKNCDTLTLNLTHATVIPVDSNHNPAAVWSQSAARSPFRSPDDSQLYNSHYVRAENSNEERWPSSHASACAVVAPMRLPANVRHLPENNSVRATENNPAASGAHTDALHRTTNTASSSTVLRVPNFSPAATLATRVTPVASVVPVARVAPVVPVTRVVGTTSYIVPVTTVIPGVASTLGTNPTVSVPRATATLDNCAIAHKEDIAVNALRTLASSSFVIPQDLPQHIGKTDTTANISSGSVASFTAQTPSGSPTCTILSPPALSTALHPSPTPSTNSTSTMTPPKPPKKRYVQQTMFKPSVSPPLPYSLNNNNNNNDAHVNNYEADKCSKRPLFHPTDQVIFILAETI